MARWCQGHSGGRWVHSELSEKTILQLMQDQNGLNGLRTNSWFWLPSNSKAGGPQWWDSPRVRGRGGGGGGGGKLWQVQQVDRKSLIRGISNLNPSHATPTLQPSEWGLYSRSGTIMFICSIFLPGRHWEYKHSSVLWTRTHINTEFGRT